MLFPAQRQLLILPQWHDPSPSSGDRVLSTRTPGRFKWWKGIAEHRNGELWLKNTNKRKKQAGEAVRTSGKPEHTTQLRFPRKSPPRSGKQPRRALTPLNVTDLCPALFTALQETQATGPAGVVLTYQPTSLDPPPFPTRMSQSQPAGLERPSRNSHSYPVSRGLNAVAL